MHRTVSIILILLHANPALFATMAGCTISINNDLTEPQPLVLRPGGAGSNAFYIPDNGDTITLSENEPVDLACPNGNLVLDGTSVELETAQATCSSGRYTINEQSLTFSAITCSVKPFHTARYTGNTCLSQYREIEIGFIVGTRFIRIMLICFDSSVQSTLYSEFNLTKTIAGHQSGYPRPGWRQSSFYNLNGKSLNNLYARKKQRATINNLLGLDTSSYKYVAETGNLYLARGHLSAKADFLYGSQQRATFYLVNATPQWQMFNGRNWMHLESNVRKFAGNRGLDLIVYTGTYGVTTLPHEGSGEEIELYLYVNGTTRAIPVPRLYWKLLYDPITKAGVVFVGVNNPYVLNVTKDIICIDISSQYSWLTWKAYNKVFGYSYACTVADFRRTVSTVPNLEVTQLLK